MPENKTNFVLELRPCNRCGNAFMVKKGEIKPDHELVCNNCIKLEERKKTLMLGVFDKVIEIESKMEDSINEMKSQLNVAKGKFNKQFFLKQIKQRAETLKKSIELVEKIEETNDEKFIDEYVNLFENIKKENID